MSETAEQTLVRILKGIVEKKGPGYYPVGDLVDQLKIELDEPWINSTSVGRMLRRLGFMEKRRVANRSEVRLTKKMIEFLSKRFLNNEKC